MKLLGRRFTSMSPESDIGGLAFFSAMRGLVVPPSWGLWLALGCLLSLLAALWCGLFRRGPRG